MDLSLRSQNAGLVRREISDIITNLALHLFKQLVTTLLDFFSHGLIKDLSSILPSHRQVQDGSCVYKKRQKLIVCRGSASL